ncbi:ABC transporter substrate-binding protein [Microbacterium galbinum]|uniref:ABC transporter substrate-binding protein n=1 Tax=Microbacterium galbinum TaxID=2851646 RepID=A0ABY4IVI4_9MICO|nr:ABC transporter substrate-binding protein [Microbacterium galbinum]UPL15710.1 ABC transporter substrate-binding protein [Microbacterium galbinum]
MRSTPVSLVALAATCLLLTSCAASSAGGSSTADDTVELTTPTGVDITIPAEPTAALGFYTTDLDILITLGFDLAGTQPIRDDFMAFPDFFPQEELEGLETFGNFPEFNLEAVLEAEPDFILSGLGYEEDLDGQLQKIAPTYTYNAFDGGDWRDVVAKAATDLGREEQWQEWVDQYEARIADIRSRLDAADIHPVVADVGYWDGQVTTSCYGVPCLVFADLGLEMAPLMNATEDGLPASDEYAELSPEQLGQLEGIDVVFTGAEEDGTVWVEEDEALQQNAIWQNLSFVQDGEYYPYNYEMIYGSPSGMDAFLTVVEKALLG